MKKIGLCLIICISLLAVPVRSVIYSTSQASPAQSYTISESPVTVYGVDYSRTIFNQISRNSFRDYIIKLTENGSRWIQSPVSMSDANQEARNWISEELARVSDNRIQVEILGEYQSVLGCLPGYFPMAAPAILVGGHFDSVPAGPGANDDGTGVASILELARVLSKYNWPLDIYFGAWNAEEIGLLGSREVANIMSERDIELLVHYNVDMLLVPDPLKLSVLMAYPIGSYQNGKYWADIPVAMSSNYGHDRIEPVISSDFSGWQSSDHWPFIQKGYTRSLFAHESGFIYDNAYHTSGDVWNNPLYNYDIGVEGVKAIGASIAFTMQRAYQQLNRGSSQFYLNPGLNMNFSIPISGSTTINITSRWYSGYATFTLYSPQGDILNQVIKTETSPWEKSIVMEQAVTSEGVYTLQVYNQGITSTGFDLVWEYDTDVNGNDVPDSQEYWFDVNYFSLDSDSDSLTDAHEMILGTSWLSADSDSDQMPDNWEIENNLNPLDSSDATGDEDGDSLSNLDEFLNGCNPHLIDSDSDQIPDNYEVEHGLNPTVNDASEDADNDLVSNLDEYLQGTDPQYAELRLERYVVPMISLIGVLAVIIAGVIVWHRRR
jgi:hypothetical protein